MRSSPGHPQAGPACNDLRPRLGLTVTTLNVGIIDEHLTSQQAPEHAAGLAVDQTGLARVANIGRAQYSNPGPTTPALRGSPESVDTSIWLILLVRAS
jgi:hypothetical protein